jgi:hydroxyacylglutathione hydrolase
MGFILKNNSHHYYKCWDTGYIPIIIKRSLKKINIVTASIAHIFLIHSDYDHVGGIKLFKNTQV